MFKTGKGFTLVELIVVISIIAILATAGIAIYSNAQKNARDGVRKAEITALAKSIETTKDPIASTYSYDSTAYGNDFTRDKPKDPLNGTPTYTYATSTGTIPAMPADPTVWTTANPSAPAAIDNSTTAYGTLTANSTGAWQTAITAVKYWKICALLETGTAPNVYCKSSLNP